MRDVRPQPFEDRGPSCGYDVGAPPYLELRHSVHDDPEAVPRSVDSDEKLRHRYWVVADPLYGRG